MDAAVGAVLRTTVWADEARDSDPLFVIAQKRSNARSALCLAVNSLPLSS